MSKKVYRTHCPLLSISAAGIFLLFYAISLPFLEKIAFAADWPMFQGRYARNGVSSESFRIPQRINWVVNTRKGLAPAYMPVEFSVPAVSDKRIFVGTSLGLFYCISEKGEVLWKFDSGSPVESSAAVQANKVFFGNNNGTFFALDKLDGSVIWRYETGGEISSSPLPVNDSVYFLNNHGELYALDAISGKKQWYYKRTPSHGVNIRGSSSPSYDGIRLYAGFPDGFTVALHPSDGLIIWETRLNDSKKQFKDVDSAAVPDGDNLFVSAYDGLLYSLNAADGKVKWSFDGGSSGTVVVTSNAVYLPSSRGEVYALDKNTGDARWVHKLESGVPSSLISAGEFIMVGLSTDGVAALRNDNGEEQWRYSPGSGVTGGLAYSDRHLYFLSNGGFIYAIPGG